MVCLYDGISAFCLILLSAIDNTGARACPLWVNGDLMLLKIFSQLGSLDG